MKNKKKFALCLSTLMVLANLLSLAPMQVFAQGNTEPKAADMMSLTPAVEITAENTSSTESNGMNRADWEIKEETDNSIVLGNYLGTSNEAKIPSMIDGKQVYITKFPGAPAPGVSKLPDEEKRIVSVTTVAVEEGTKVKAKDTSLAKSPKLGADINNRNDAVKDQLSYVDLGAFDITGWTGMHSMFRNRYNLTTIKGLDQWDTSKITDLGFLFSGTKFTDLDQLANWDVSNVTRLSGMFSQRITSIEALKNWDVSSVKQMANLFAHCRNLKSIAPIANWDVSNAEDMTYMFLGCTGIQDFSPVFNWNVSNAKHLEYMFSNSSLEFADLSQWKLNPNVGIARMFQSDVQKPLLIVTDNEKLASYDFAADGRVGVQMTFETEGMPAATSDARFVIADAKESTIQSIIDAETAKVATPVKPGFIFDRWEAQGTMNNAYDALSATYQAVFRPLEFTVTFETNGADLTPAQQTVAYNALIEKPQQDPSQDGLVFVGWEVTAGPADLIGKEWNFASDTMPQHDITLSALWTDQVAVTFEYNGGTTSSDESGFYQIGQLLPMPNVTNPDFVLDGWYTDEALTNKWDFDTDTVPNHDLHLYAKWVKPMTPVNHVPTITASDLVLTVGDSFNPLAGVSAYDHEDGEIVLTEANILANDVNMNVAGTYHITYHVTDRSGASVQKTIQVTVEKATTPLTPIGPSENVTPSIPTEPTVPSEPSNPTTPETPSNTPSTGDMTSLVLLSVLCVLSAGMVTILLFKKKIAE